MRAAGGQNAISPRRQRKIYFQRTGRRARRSVLTPYVGGRTTLIPMGTHFRRRRSNVIFSFALSCLLWLGAAPASAAEEQAAFFPVMAWDGPKNDLAFLQRMRACG